MAAAKDHFGKGKALFEAKEFEAAVAEFKESYKLSKNPVLLYNIAFTHDEIGDQPLAIFYYEKFLRDTDSSAGNRDVAQTRLRELKKATSGTDTGAEVQSVTSFKHTIVDEAPPNTPLDIVAVVPEGVPWRVVLHYRPAGKVKYTSVEMHYRFKELVGRIPAAETRSKTVQYYLEVEDGSGKVLERSGEPTSPHIVYMEFGAKPRFYADTSESATGAGVGAGLGAGSGSGSGSASTGDGGWTDVQSSKFDKLKWGTTAGAAVVLLVSGSFYLISSNYSSDLEDESVDSRTGQCLNGPPCKQFAQKQKDLQSLGKTYETLGTVSLAVGVTAAAAAGVLWYLDFIDKKKSDSDSIATIPVITNDYVGAAAAIRF